MYKDATDPPKSKKTLRKNTIIAKLAELSFKIKHLQIRAKCFFTKKKRLKKLHMKKNEYKGKKKNNNYNIKIGRKLFCNFSMMFNTYYYFFFFFFFYRN